MPPISAGAAEPVPWPPRSLAPGAARSRRDLAAGLAVAALLAELSAAQATLGLTICLLAAGRLTRWRPLWLALPAAAGLAWLLAVGAGPGLAGYCAVGRQVIGYLTGPGPMAARLERLPAVLSDWRRWLPAQAPLGLLAASAQALLLTGYGRSARSAGAARSARSGGADGSRQYRAGAVVAIRGAYLTGLLRRGEVATADGGCVGIEVATGKRAAISWSEAQAGMLCTGQDPAAVTASGFELAMAAIQHRKTVIVIDLTGNPEPGSARRGGIFGGCGNIQGGLAASVSRACADAGAPLRRFGGPAGHYEPMSGASLGHAASSLIMAMIDWTGMSHARQVLCADYLDAALAVIDAAREPVPVLDELVGLLRPGELAKRSRPATGHAKGGHAIGGEALAGRVGELARQLDADPGATAPVAAQLAGLRSAPLGRWLCQPSIPAGGALIGEGAISLRAAMVDRDVVLFSLDRQVHGRPAVMIARLVVADLTEILAERSELGEPADCLIWVNDCEVISPRQVAGLIEAGTRAGTAVLLGTAAGAAAARLASEVNVIAVRGQAPPELTGSELAQVRGDQVQGAGSWPAGWACGPAASAGVPEPGVADRAGAPGGVSFDHNGSSGLPVHLLRSQHPDLLSLLVRGPRPRQVTGCLAVR